MTHISLLQFSGDDLRMMLLGMVNDPRVVLIKLADRLHNMRTMCFLFPFVLGLLNTHENYTHFQETSKLIYLIIY